MTTLIFAVVMAGVFWGLRRKPGGDINGRNAQRLEVCMSPQEVARTLGDPPGVYSRREWVPLHGAPGGLEGAPGAGERDEVWQNDHFRVSVRFAARGTLRQVSWEVSRQYVEDLKDQSAGVWDKVSRMVRELFR